MRCTLELKFESVVGQVHEIRQLGFHLPVQAYITHISHLMGLHREVEAELPDFVRLAYDGLKLAL